MMITNEFYAVSIKTKLNYKGRKLSNTHNSNSEECA